MTALAVALAGAALVVALVALLCARRASRLAHETWAAHMFAPLRAERNEIRDMLDRVTRPSR